MPPPPTLEDPIKLFYRVDSADHERCTALLRDGQTLSEVIRQELAAHFRLPRLDRGALPNPIKRSYWIGRADHEAFVPALRGESLSAVVRALLGRWAERKKNSVDMGGAVENPMHT